MTIKQGIIAALFIGGAVLVYLVATQPATAPSDATTPATNEAAPAAVETKEQATADLSGTGTLADFFARGESVRCTFTTDYEGVQSEGELWYSDERMRVESITQTAGETLTSSMINDGEQTYVWGSNAAGVQGMVFPSDMSDTTTPEAYDNPQANPGVSMDQRVSYDCESWSVDNSLFVPPSDVDFVDMGRMMQGMMDGGVPEMPAGMNN